MSIWFVTLTITAVPFAPGYLLVDSILILFILLCFYKSLRKTANGNNGEKS